MSTFRNFLNFEPLFRVMRKLPIFFLLLAVFATAKLQTSCTPGSCFEETNAYVKATFYLDGTFKAVAPDSVTLYGVGKERKLIYDKETVLTQAFIPLDASTDGCSLVIRINGVNDTISFVYTTSSHLISKECGYTFHHVIEAPVFTMHIIDTVTVVRNTITTLSEENIRIYY
jgi:hypothetical protein